MTPKEKARELVDKFYPYCNNNYIRDYYSNECALIAVDEILSNFELIHKPEYVTIFINKEIFNIYDAIEYYQEVKQEIEKI